jgi:hypothetical protein
MVGRQHQVLHDTTLAHYWLLRDHPELLPRYGRLTFRRAAGRAYKWARRRGGPGLHLRWLGLEAAAMLGLGDPLTGLKASLGAYFLGPAAAAQPIILLPD